LLNRYTLKKRIEGSNPSVSANYSDQLIDKQSSFVMTRKYVPASVLSRDAPSRLGFVPPLIPTLVDQPPAGDGWVHEIKQDGYRTQLVIDRGTVRAFTRRGHDWTAS
jgi:ATP-dependent DNA ligase